MWWVCTRVFRHQAGLSALKETLENRSVKTIPAENLIKIAEFVLKNNLVFNNKVFQQISRITIGTKFAPPCMHLHG